MRSLVFLLLVLARVFGILSYNVPFSIKIFNEAVRQNENENIVLSPTSIESVLGALLLGATGETYLDIFNVLGGDSNRIFEKIKETEVSGVEMKSANRIYLAKSYDLAPKFSVLASKYFKATAEKINFANSVDAANEINSWVESQTNNKIHNLIKTDDIDAITSAVLVNAIYFKAPWKHEFKQSDLLDQKFFITKDRSVAVSMMNATLEARIGYIPELIATAIEIPYANTDVHMLIILPKEIEGLSAMEKKLNSFDLTNINLRSSEVELHLPKFKIEFELDLDEPLENLGVKILQGNFKNITSNHEQVPFNMILHKAFLEVNEKGTEAAAATFVSKARSVATYDVEFIVDHPFYFAIRDKTETLFEGHIVKF